MPNPQPEIIFQANPPGEVEQGPGRVRQKKNIEERRIPDSCHVEDSL